MIILFFLLSFANFAFAGEPIGRVGQQRTSTLSNVRATLENSFTHKQKEDILIVLVSGISGGIGGLIGGLFANYIYEYNNYGMRTDALSGCYLDLGNISVDTCNYLNNTCYLP